jgi:hypothetical protein
MAFSPLTVSPNVNSGLHHFIGFLLLVEKLDNPRSITGKLDVCTDGSLTIYREVYLCKDD